MKSAATAKDDAKRMKSRVQSYLTALSPDSRRLLKQVRETIRAAAPDAVEHFSYGIPGFRLDGKPLMWYAAFQAHMSLYPMTAAIKRVHADELQRYEMSKGTIRFPLSKPPSSALVKRLVKTRVAEIRQGSKS